MSIDMQFDRECLLSPYEEFIRDKAIIVSPVGMRDIPELPLALKPFQRAITTWALRRGRAALFEGTGLGKTIQQLSWARAVADHERGQVLILTPLAVAEQTKAEAKKFGISSVDYAESRRGICSDIVLTNYERFGKFDSGNFCGIVLDESGIIKSFNGKIRALLTDACREIPWRLCCTATPAPNDYTELGQHAEFLGIMSSKEMLSMFFVHDGSIRAGDSSNGDGWRLKGHAQADFWRWLASWAVVIGHPRDIGFDDPGYDLPSLNLHEHIVRCEYKPIAGQLFPFSASSLGERISVRRDTVGERVAAAAEIVANEPDQSWLIWCNLNSEADAIEASIPGAMQVAGRHNIGLKTERLFGFTVGRPPILVSKPTIAGHGMNWQHCARMVFVGLTDSFEQIYQAMRRCWRFGQTRPVEVHFIVSELEGNVIANIRRKECSYEAMMANMTDHVRDLLREEIIGAKRTFTTYDPNVAMEVPSWM